MNEEDLYRTIGYVMAQDRMWQMDLIRRITTGRLSEVLDPGLVGADQLFRAIGFSEKSERIIEQEDPEVLACIGAYCDGINQYIEDYQRKLPFEFAMLGYKPDPWELVHTYNMIGYMHWTLASGWNEDMALYKLSQLLDTALFAELLPDMDLHTAPVFPNYGPAGGVPELTSHMDEAIDLVEQLGLQIFQASNNWAVSGDRSETGMPLFSNDMHLGQMSPGIWYQMHLVVEGKFNITGVGFPCSPYIVAGHNEHIAWGWTNLYVDDTDFYLETLHPQDSNRYLLDGEWKEMRVVTEIIPVKGSDEPEKRINRYTHRGPVISGFKDISDRAISMRWQGREKSGEFRTVHLLPKARNWEEFRHAVSTFYVGQNANYADVNGNIGMQTVGGVPIRKGSGIMVYPGDTSLYDWTGQIPFEELPSVYNPESGQVSSANNRTVGEDYPYLIGHWYAQPYRIERIREMLEEKEKLGMDDFKRMQKDQLSHLARKLTPMYINALEGQMEGIYLEAFRELEMWDYNMEATSPAALAFEISWLQLIQVLIEDEMGEHLEVLTGGGGLVRNLLDRIITQGGSAWCDDVTTPGITETLDDNLRKSFRLAVDKILTMFGEQPGDWKWGDLHTVSLEHPMGSVEIVDRLFRVNRGPYPTGGSFHTVCPYSYPAGESFKTNHMSSQRHIYNTADWDQSLTVIPTGTSGIPGSPYYLDQTEMFLRNEYHRDYFSREAVESNMKHKAVFE
jgi:penicillin amidase